jgi:hypothetical protein
MILSIEHVYFVEIEEYAYLLNVIYIQTSMFGLVAFCVIIMFDDLVKFEILVLGLG